MISLRSFFFKYLVLLVNFCLLIPFDLVIIFKTFCVFCSFLFGKLTEKDILPCFALFYGSANGIGEYNYDITEEYDDYKIDKCFK